MQNFRKVNIYRDGIAEWRRLFPSNNLMTPHLVAFYHRPASAESREVNVELSYGEGMSGNGLWGVTVCGPDGARALGLSKCCFSESAALEYIDGLEIAP